MQDQTSDPRPAATSVSDYYRNARSRVFSQLMVEALKDRTLLRAPTWEEDALSVALDELLTTRMRDQAARTEVSQTEGFHAARATLAGSAVPSADAHLTRLIRLADEIASLNTLLHWGWIKDNRLVKIGGAILEAAGIDDEADGPA